jgi:5-formyltetrahydrofolate cyclo-ligase
MHNKNELREKVLEKRNALGLAERRAKSRAIMERLFRLDSFQYAEAIMLYVSFGSEVETQKGIEKVIKMGKRVFIPDAVGVLEVGRDSIKRGDPGEIDLVVVPGIAFDFLGNRLGYGTGWYDKFVRRLKPGVDLIGVAFEEQIVGAIPNEVHDIRVHEIVTESRVIDTHP